MTSVVSRRVLLPRALDRQGRGVDLRLPSRAGDDVGSGFHQTVDQGASDAGGAAEDDRDASCEVESCEGHRMVSLARARFASSDTWRPAMIAGPTPLGSLSTTRSLM